MRIITLFFFAALFLLLKPSVLESSSLWYQDDDYDYFAHASSIAYGQFPHYDKEFFTNKGLPLGAVGSGILAAPFVFTFSLIDRVTHQEIVRQRTHDNVLHSWSLYGFIVSTIFYFWLGCAFLYRGLRFHFPCAIACWTILLMIFAQGLPLFAFRRPMFSHIYEFFLQSIMIYFFLKSFKMNWTWKDFSWGQIVLIGAVCGLITLVRYNNLLISLTWPLILTRATWADLKNSRFFTYLGAIFGIALLMIAFFKMWPGVFVADQAAYLSDGSSAIQRLGHFQSPVFYLKRLLYVFLGLDWGLLYTAPLACLGLVCLIRPQGEINRKILWLLAPLLINLYCILSWNSQGGWYGYRYIIASLFPLLLYPLAWKLESIQQLPQRSWIYFCLILIAAFPILSMFCFEASGGGFTLYFYNEAGWSNLTFQHQIWKTFLFKPSVILEAWLTAGPTYILYLIKNALHWMHLSVKPYVDEYADFNPVTLIKMSFLYVMPFLLYAIGKYFDQHSSASVQENE